MTTGTFGALVRSVQPTLSLVFPSDATSQDGSFVLCGELVTFHLKIHCPAANVDLTPYLSLLGGIIEAFEIVGEGSGTFGWQSHGHLSLGNSPPLATSSAVGSGELSALAGKRMKSVESLSSVTAALTTRKCRGEQLNGSGGQSNSTSLLASPPLADMHLRSVGLSPALSTASVATSTSLAALRRPSTQLSLQRQTPLLVDPHTILIPLEIFVDSDASFQRAVARFKVSLHELIPCFESADEGRLDRGPLRMTDSPLESVLLGGEQDGLPKGLRAFQRIERVAMVEGEIAVVRPVSVGLRTAPLAPDETLVQLTLDYAALSEHVLVIDQVDAMLADALTSRRQLHTAMSQEHFRIVPLALQLPLILAPQDTTQHAILFKWTLLPEHLPPRFLHSLREEDFRFRVDLSGHLEGRAVSLSFECAVDVATLFSALNPVADGSDSATAVTVAFSLADPRQTTLRVYEPVAVDVLVSNDSLEMRSFAISVASYTLRIKEHCRAVSDYMQGTGREKSGHERENEHKHGDISRNSELERRVGQVGAWMTRQTEDGRPCPLLCLDAPLVLLDNIQPGTCRQARLRFVPLQCGPATLDAVIVKDVKSGMVRQYDAIFSLHVIK